MEQHNALLIALVAGFLLDAVLGDPKRWPHPIVGFGKLISWCEKRFNNGDKQLLKGAIITIILVGCTYLFTYVVLSQLMQNSPIIGVIFATAIVFFSLSALTLRREVRKVFEALNSSVEKGRRQLSFIVGRDTNALDPQQIRVAALETLSENLNDGVIAPLFWLAILGIPGMFAYKMVNTLDSMIGYKNKRYLLFGRCAARLDDVANWIPARLTAILMLLVSGRLKLLSTVWKQAKNNASPNSGYPEAALASILQCRFGGPNFYFGELVEKPYIGNNERTINTYDMIRAFSINRWSEVVMLFMVAFVIYYIH